LDIDRLLNQARAGDQAAESQLLEYLSARFRLLAEQRVEDREAAEDIAQTALMVVLSKYRKEVFSKGFEPWAYGILRMKIGNYYQKRAVRRIERPKDAETLGAVGVPDVDPNLERQLINCLKKIFKINSRYARTLVLTYLGYSAEDVCRRLHVSRQNHYSNLHRARIMLKTCLETGRV
jgi:RNA polymerase sigma-70 factor (ECF subfamily)